MLLVSVVSGFVVGLKQSSRVYSFLFRFLSVVSFFGCWSKASYSNLLFLVFVVGLKQSCCVYCWLFLPRQDNGCGRLLARNE